jgi:hypothetical protein
MVSFTTSVPKTTLAVPTYKVARRKSSEVKNAKAFLLAQKNSVGAVSKGEPKFVLSNMKPNSPPGVTTKFVTLNGGKG